MELTRTWILLGEGKDSWESRMTPGFHHWSLGDEDTIKQNREFRRRRRFYFVHLDGGKPETTQGEGSEGEEKIDKGGTIVAATAGCWWRPSDEQTSALSPQPHHTTYRGPGVPGHYRPPNFTSSVTLPRLHILHLSGKYSVIFQVLSDDFSLKRKRRFLHCAPSHT